MVHGSFEKCATTKKNIFYEVGSNNIVTLITFLLVFGLNVKFVWGKFVNMYIL
jgi:hypothetical protein